MKTTLELPEATWRQAVNLAAVRGISPTQFLTEALEATLRQRGPSSVVVDPPWMQGFGALADLKPDSQQVTGRIDQEFERVEPEDR